MRKRSLQEVRETPPRYGGGYLPTTLVRLCRDDGPGYPGTFFLSCTTPLYVLYFLLPCMRHIAHLRSCGTVTCLVLEVGCGMFTEAPKRTYLGNGKQHSGCRPIPVVVRTSSSEFPSMRYPCYEFHRYPCYEFHRYPYYATK
jgi:hypothetical protein